MTVTEHRIPPRRRSVAERCSRCCADSIRVASFSCPRSIRSTTSRSDCAKREVSRWRRRTPRKGPRPREEPRRNARDFGRLGGGAARSHKIREKPAAFPPIVPRDDIEHCTRGSQSSAPGSELILIGQRLLTRTDLASSRWDDIVTSCWTRPSPTIARSGSCARARSAWS